MEKFRTWFENSLWNWANAINYRFVQYNDNIDRLAFFEEINYGWYQMRDQYIMSQPNFDPYNMSGRDYYYSYVMINK